MACKVVPGALSEGSECAREAVCIHTKKIFDACQSKDCVEDLRFYPTEAARGVLGNAHTVKGGCAELLRVFVNVEPVCFERGYYAVDMRYFYRIRLQAYQSTSLRPTEIEGLSVFDKRCILFGSEGSSKTFASSDPLILRDDPGLPEAVVEALDPMVLGVRFSGEPIPPEPAAESGDEITDVPASVSDDFASPLLFSNYGRGIRVSLGQFSIVRLERDTQLLIPAFDYCLPEKHCACSGGSSDPCELFDGVCFPTSEFFPPDSVDCSRSDYQTTKNLCCGSN